MTIKYLTQAQLLQFYFQTQSRMFVLFNSLLVLIPSKLIIKITVSFIMLTSLQMLSYLQSKGINKVRLRKSRIKGLLDRIRISARTVVLSAKQYPLQRSSLKRFLSLHTFSGSPLCILFFKARPIFANQTLFRRITSMSTHSIYL